MQRRLGGRKGDHQVVGQQWLGHCRSESVMHEVGEDRRSRSGLTLLVSEAVARAGITNRCRRSSGQLQGVVVWR